MAGLKRYGKRVFLATSQLLNALLGGDEDETLSSRAGKARARGRRWGCVLCRVLDALDKDHCIKAIERDEGAPAPAASDPAAP